MVAKRGETTQDFYDNAKKTLQNLRKQDDQTPTEEKDSDKNSSMKI